MKKATSTIIASLGLLIMFSSCSRETKDEKFRRDFRQFTERECPKEMDPYTRQDSVAYDIPSRTLTFYYTVKGDLDNDTIYTNELTDPFREMLLKDLKSSIQLKQYKDEGITFRHNYRSSSTGETLLEIAFTSEDYQ